MPPWMSSDGPRWLPYAGIDIAKDQIDTVLGEVEFPPGGGSEEPGSTRSETFHSENTSEGRDWLVQRLREAEPTRIFMEDSGGLERPAVAALGAADLPAVVMGPIQTNEFAKSLGWFEKTDRIDAEVLALFGERV